MTSSSFHPERDFDERQLGQINRPGLRPGQSAERDLQWPCTFEPLREVCDPDRAVRTHRSPARPANRCPLRRGPDYLRRPEPGRQPLGPRPPRPPTHCRRRRRHLSRPLHPHARRHARRPQGRLRLPPYRSNLPASPRRFDPRRRLPRRHHHRCPACRRPSLTSDRNPSHRRPNTLSKRDQPRTPLYPRQPRLPDVHLRFDRQAQGRARHPPQRHAPHDPDRALVPFRRERRLDHVPLLRL